MKTYDPMKGMVYRHMAGRADPFCAQVINTARTNRLPAGYPNGSPRTYLGRTWRTFPAA